MRIAAATVQLQGNYRKIGEQMRIGPMTAIMSLGASLFLSSCTSTPQPASSNIQTDLEEPYPQKGVVKISIGWPRLGPLTSYDALVQANEAEGLIDVYGEQTCRGRFEYTSEVPDFDGLWELFCADDGTYAGGFFQLNDQGTIIASGIDMYDTQISFTLPVPD
ncbi:MULTISPECIES: hypothetical protein [Thalassospira]|uniref:hypothetical protein n=1 Tax=Thalassospira TaxID=168934 RepID=UPI000EDD53AC|nr:MULTISPECIES: hypothetical protein [Thalassospira]HAI30150.1 hypothetical protein [Thalassospira sp.]